MKKISALMLVIVLLIVGGAPARADDEFELIPMRKGDVSLYDGVLLLAPAVAIIIAEREQFDDRLRLELDRASREHDAKLNFEIDRASIEREMERRVLNARVDAVSRQLEIVSKENRKLERSRVRAKMWIALGFAAGAVVSGFAVIGIERAVRR